MYALLAGAVALIALLAPAPAARAATEIYLIQVADLLNMPQECGSASRYNRCGPTDQPGFEFTDVVPSGSEVTSVTLEFNHGIQCAESDHVFEAEFNGAALGTFTSDRWCNCTSRRNILGFTVPVELYRPRGVNTFLIVNPESCQGMVPDSDLGQAFARVTVEYIEGSGGGGDCDLTPVLERIDLLDEDRQAADQVSAGHVSQEHAVTRQVVLDQHAAGRLVLADEAALTRQVVLDQHGATRQAVDEGHATTRQAVAGEHAETRDLVGEEAARTREFLETRVLRLLVEQDLAGKETTALACLPEEFGGRLELTISVVLETIDAFTLAGCDVTEAEGHYQRGNDDVAAGRYARACSWYLKAYQTADEDCP